MLEYLLPTYSPSERYGPRAADDWILNQDFALEMIRRSWERPNEAKIILATGSVARRWADKHSDLDIFIGTFSDRPSFETGEREFLDQSLDVKHLPLRRISDCPMQMLQCIGESAVIFSSSDEILDQVRDAAILSQAERFACIQAMVLQIGWTGFQPSHWTDKLIFGYHWKADHQFWIDRGDVVSAHQNLEKALGYFINLLFVVNWERYPGRKWKYYLVRKLKWLPVKVDDLFELLPTVVRDKAGYFSISNALAAAIDETILRLCDENLIASNVYRHFEETPLKERFLDIDR